MMNERAWATAHITADAQAGKGDGKPSPGRARFTGVVLILLSLVAAALCYAAFTVWLPSDRQRYQDYRAAEPCPAHATAQVRKDCLSTWPFTVVKTVNRTGKDSRYEATLKDGDSLWGDVDFGDPGPLLERLKPGDRVTATFWRGEVTALTRDGVEQKTSDAPRDELQMNAALGMLAGLLAAQAFVFGVARIVGPRSHGLLTWQAYGRWMLVTIAAACFGVGLPAVWIGIPWTFVPPAVPAVVCVAVLTHHRRLRRRTAEAARRQRAADAVQRRQPANAAAASRGSAPPGGGSGPARTASPNRSRPLKELTFLGKDRYRPDWTQMSLVGVLLTAEGVAAYKELGVAGFGWLVGVTTALAGLAVLLALRSRTRVGAAGITICRGLGRGRTYPWNEIRWIEAHEARSPVQTSLSVRITLANGRRRRLPALQHSTQYPDPHFQVDYWRVVTWWKASTDPAERFQPPRGARTWVIPTVAVLVLCLLIVGGMQLVITVEG